MALKMMFIALFAAFVTASASSLRAEVLALDGLAQQYNMEEVEENILSESFERNEFLAEEEEDMNYQKLLDEEMKSPNKIVDESNAEVMEDDSTTKAKKLRDFIYQLYGCGSRPVTSRSRPVTQGDNIALQRNETYLGCGNDDEICTEQSCSDASQGGLWTKCRSLVFRIYHKEGAGYIRVGDSVGLYHLLSDNWFSMQATHFPTHDRNCPGTPTIENGFQDQSKWTSCFGEVLQIYARGKSNGDVINENDDIMLYFAHWGTYLGIFRSQARAFGCGGRVDSHSPGDFDKCNDLVFKILKM